MVYEYRGLFAPSPAADIEKSKNNIKIRRNQ